jgi:hypothetical protein
MKIYAANLGFPKPIRVFNGVLLLGTSTSETNGFNRSATLKVRHRKKISVLINAGT